MGLFLHVILFPGGDGVACRAALVREAEDAELSVNLEECRWHQYEKGPAVQLSDYANGWETAGRLSDGMDGPVLLAYIYDEDFWGYDLWQDGKFWTNSPASMITSMKTSRQTNRAAPNWWAAASAWSRRGLSATWFPGKKTRWTPMLMKGTGVRLETPGRWVTL